MTVFDELGTLIGDARLAVDDFSLKVSGLNPLLGDEAILEAEPVNIDDYIRSIVAEYLQEETGTIEATPNEKRYVGHQNNDKGEELPQKAHSMGDSPHQINEEESSTNQLQVEIASLRKQILLLEQLPMKVAMLPDKADIVAIVQEQINESNRYHNADDPDFMDEAHSAPQKYG